MKMIKLDKGMQGMYQCIGINHQGMVTYTTQLIVECEFYNFYLIHYLIVNRNKK